MEEKKVYYTTVATKVSCTDKQKLLFIAQSFGMSFYELLQALLLAIIRHFDKDTAISEEFAKLMETFITTIKASRCSFNLLSIKSRHSANVNNAIFFAQTKAGVNPQVISIAKDIDGNITENYNTDQMLSDFLKSTDPQALKVLEREKKELGFFSLGQTLHEVVTKTRLKQGDKISEEIKTLFDDIRIPTGEKLNDGIYYKRIKNNYISQSTATKKYIHVDL